MDGEEAPWRTPSRSSGADRPGIGENVAGGSSSQKRKRHAKKRRRNSAGGAADAAAPSEKESDRTDASAAKEWGCPACTYLNEAARRFCEMCGTSNPTKPAPEAAPSEWSCVACTMKNAPTLRVCAVCGTINPNPSLPPVLSIARHGGLFLAGGNHGLYGGMDEEEDDEEDGEGDSDEGSNSSGDSISSSDEDSDRRLECPCVECGVTIRADRTSCSACHAPRPVPRRKLERSDLSSRLHKLTRKIAKQDKSSKKKKNKDASCTKNAYGVSSEVLQKLMNEPKSSKLVDTLQALTHTLAMMDASADSEWGDVHGSGVGAFFVHGFGGRVGSDKGKDTALLGLLAAIFRDDSRQYPPEVRLLSVQSINYILKMDRHLFKKDETLDIVRIYIGVLQKWSSATLSPRSKARIAAKDELMIVEECVNGLCGLCGSEGAMLRELITPKALNDYLAFLEPLAAASTSHLHVSVVSSALDLFQKCCVKIKWDKLHSETSSSEVPSLALASRIIRLLRMFLKHSLPGLHVSASKCLLMLLHRSGQSSHTQTSVSSLINGDVVLELVEVLTSKNPEETEESRQAAAALLIHLLDHEKELLESVIRDKIYEPLVEGIVSHLLQPNASGSLTSHVLQLISLLIRRVCRRPVIKSNGKSRSGKDFAAGHHQNRLRLDSSPDPDVLANLLLDFIRADSIPAVSALIKDGADLNFPSIYDSNGRELEKPLVVAAEVASLSMVRFLVKRGVDVHQTGPKGTALHVAALEGRCDVVSFLLECGASPLDVDREGRSVLKRIDETDESETRVSPVRKLLELHQRVLPVGEDSDASEDGRGIHHHGGRRWLVSGDHPFDDDDDDDDEFDDEDNYMDYDDDDDDEMDSDEDHDEDSDDEDTTAAEKIVEGFTPSPGERKTRRKRRRESVVSDRSEDKDSKKICRANGSLEGEGVTSERNAEREYRGSSNNASEGTDLTRLSADQVDAFSVKVICSLLQTLRAIDHQNVNRSVLSTLASALEMAPSSLVRNISEAEISLLLETVNHLLQDPAILSQRVVGSADGEIAAIRTGSTGDSRSSGVVSSSASQAAQKAMLASYILALRILQAIVRKSVRESAVFYEIERRGICEQIERLHAHSSKILHSTHGDEGSQHHDHSSAIFGRGLQLLEFLRSNMVESGMLHLHRLRNMTRRLRELTDNSPPEQRDLVLVDLVELFEKENSITSHEFKQSDLLESILAFLVPPGRVDPVDARLNLFLESFAKSAAAFNNLITRLQAVVNQEENLPLISFFSGKGRELYPLTKQLRIVCARVCNEPNDEPTQKMLQLSSLTHFQSFEKTIFRCMPVKDARLASFYFNLVGQCVHKAIDGKWKKFMVCGFDPVRCMHMLRPLDGAVEDCSEVVLHDSQYKLSTAVDVFEELSVDFSIFGEIIQKDLPDESAAMGDGKKRKRQSKKRKKSSINSNLGTKGVEVQNCGTTNAGKMKGAWYAGELVEDSDGGGDAVDSEQVVFEPGKTYKVRLLTSGTTLKDVPGDRIRVRTEDPQVGSVVEVDGLLGEVARVDRSGGVDGGDSVFDVKVSRDRERKGIAKSRIRYPPSSNTTPAPTGVIEAMSLSRLFPPRESSLAVGSLGDRVWVAPKGSSGDFFVAGSVHSFPSGPDAIGPSAVVYVEVSFGTKTTVIKVDQSRVTNLAIGRSRLGSSRLLSALNMSGERTSSGQTLHRLLQSSAPGSDLFGSRSLPGSGSAIDQLRQFLSHSSSSRESSLTSLLNAASGDSAAATVSVSTDGEGDAQSNKTKEDGYPLSAAHVSRLIKAGGKRLFAKCVRPPRMKVLMGYERRDDVDSHGFDRGYEEEFGFSNGLLPSTRRIDTVNRNAALTHQDPATNKTVLKPLVAEALSSVYSSFDPTVSSFSGSFGKKSKKGKKKKQKMDVKQLGETSPIAGSSPGEESAAWDIDKFSSFMQTALGASAMDDPDGTLVDNCIQFSLFATPSSRRRLLEREGFLAAMADLCKSARNARHLLAYLVSRGHMAATLTEEDTRAVHKVVSGVNDCKSADSCNDKEEIALRTFPPDQNMLSCLHELQLQKSEPIDGSPPWKFKYFVRCDVAVDWSNVNKRDSESSSDPFETTSDSAEKSHLRTIRGVPTDSSMMKAVRLLSYLFEASPKSMQGPDDVWRNARLSNKLETQLEDVLSVCSGIYPEWCDAVVSQCKFFFPRQLREKLFQATSFGCTRSLHWFRAQLNVDDSGGSSNNSTSESLSNGPGIASDGIYNHEITISPIPKERVKVNRENLLNSAEAIMKMHGKRKAILDIVFIGEKGYGSGVTAAFYSATAQALQSVVENNKGFLRLWVPGIEDEREDEAIRHPNGLFPFPHVSAVNVSVVERFRMMGRLAGKALMDSRLFPLPLSVQFMKLVLGQRVSLHELDRVFLNHGKILREMKRAVEQLEAGVNAASIKIEGMTVAEWLDAVSFTFVEPLSQQPLEPKGEDKEVTVENLKVFVDKVLSLWLHEGIQAQVQAFREGISDVLPLEKLNLLFVDELLALLCGDADIAWDVESLTATMKLAHGYTKDSKPVQFFVEVLAEMSVPERREFLLYATGCPNLPAGGFAALRPPFEVVRRVVDTDDVDQALPFARTCTNTLHLPAYSSKRVLDERLRYAVANSAGVIDRD